MTFKVKKAAIQLVQAVAFLHSTNLTTVHLDIKPTNVLNQRCSYIFLMSSVLCKYVGWVWFLSCVFGWLWCSEGPDQRDNFNNKNKLFLFGNWYPWIPTHGTAESWADWWNCWYLCLRVCILWNCSETRKYGRDWVPSKLPIIHDILAQLRPKWVTSPTFDGLMLWAATCTDFCEQASLLCHHLALMVRTLMWALMTWQLTLLFYPFRHQSAY